MIKRIKELYVYRELIRNFTSRDLKLKYKNSALGFLWSFFNPLLMMIVYTIVFGKVLDMGVPNFPVFIIVGILPWMFFQTSVVGGTHSIVSNAPLIRKVYFARDVIPFSVLLTNFINYLITLLVVMIALLIYKIQIGLPILLLPVILLLFFVFTYGLVLMLSALNVMYRDVSHFVEIAFMAWMYLTPIIYSFDRIPSGYRWFFYLNPMTLVINCIRDVTMYKTINYSYLAGLFVFSLVFLSLGYTVFAKYEKSFAEEI